jgi:hypothetical protein
MRKKNTDGNIKLLIDSTIDINTLAVDLVFNNSEDTIFRLITNLESEVADVLFLKKLIKHFKNELEKDENIDDSVKRFAST